MTSRRNTQSVQTTHTPTVPSRLFPPVHNNPTILAPHCSLDTVALIFLFSTLPTWVSCIVLSSYILLGSFKSLASKSIAKWLFNFDQSVQFSLDACVSRKNKFYRSELIGQFLQLFSINSFILLVFHYSLPPVWSCYLTILAKAIVASRLVGTFTTGSTTYVSVVSNSTNSNVTTTTTTTTTTCNHATSYSNSSHKSEYRYATNSFLNSLVSCATVLAVDFCVKKLDALFFLEFLRGNAAKHNLPLALHNLIFMLPDADADFKDIQVTDARFHYSQSFASRLFLLVMARFFKLDHNHIRSLSHFLKDFSVATYYAYLVLCIHVISLAIAPFLRKVFILKSYLRTLDHLSVLTPDIPHGGLKRNSLVSGVTRDTTSNAVVVINVELVQQKSTSVDQGLKVIKVNPAQYMGYDFSLAEDSSHNVSAENFKNFCLIPPTNKTSSVSTKTNHTKTIVDRKKTATNSIPSTTIMEKYFTISIQPLWSWLAALKIITREPLLFAGSRSNLRGSGTRDLHSKTRTPLKCCVVSIEDSCVTFEVLDEPINAEELTVEVNGIAWDFVDVFQSEDGASSAPKTFISVFFLSPLALFDIAMFLARRFAGSFLVSTRLAQDSSFLTESEFPSQIDSLRASLSTAVTSLGDLKQNIEKAKNEENKRLSDLCKQLYILKSKYDNGQSADSSDARLSSKIKGLQNSLNQLEAEIRNLEGKIAAMQRPGAQSEDDFANKERQLLEQISELQESISNYEAESSKLRQDTKMIEGEKASMEAKLKKMETKLQDNREEIQKLVAESKSLKRALIMKIQRKRRNMHERYELIIANILDAAN
ncbi:hypothetical protein METBISCDRAFT_16597 [Metschnikowia bicuspidata]|uniref:Uncharacterized protein n=1 Tax=Metschnikowia bicuspidata TaxID=27322 RepID=A0A4P9ZC99_9ASCO|nr:hypothetical protein METBISCDRAFT_16597 [Metschnikowia bicuspidata]